MQKNSDIQLIYDAIEHIKVIKYRLARFGRDRRRYILIHSDTQIRYMIQLRKMQFSICNYATIRRWETN